MVLGIILGFGSAFLQSVSYLSSRIFVNRDRKGVLRLISLSHIIMGVLSVVILVFVWPNKMLAFKEYAFNLLACSFFYLAGQVCLFMALKRSDASRVSPLLGIKVFLLAIISVCFLKQSFSVLQWLSIILSITAAGVLACSGGKLAKTTILWTLLACLAYCFSDLNIKPLVTNFRYLGLGYASVLSVCLCYSICGLAGVVILCFQPRSSKGMWAGAAAFTLSWFVGQFLLFACFTLLGVVPGNIIQSSRGMISILIGFLLASAGFESLEERISRRTLLERVGAALLMSGAIALYFLGA